ncbi:uncharacterized protein PpBr36_10146 [Pyricularia pennisetigena]|uniref:uncharacterized protein n=1 Tax=Pyricularia pennisetigena TaxID=1578925 RepID=UPI00115247A9|nr:uncharacterized protein PpBr36_10146 [Pyricularia pennisetigena]TLS21425.1 hypothetical protein PpBr36_10146 [Pyricularia pennisetigena]
MAITALPTRQRQDTTRTLPIWGISVRPRPPFRLVPVGEPVLENLPHYRVPNPRQCRAPIPSAARTARQHRSAKPPAQHLHDFVREHMVDVSVGREERHKLPHRLIQRQISRSRVCGVSVCPCQDEEPDALEVGWWSRGC